MRSYAPEPCPLGCGALTTPPTLEAHFARAHPEHHVHLMEIPLCEHAGVTLGAVHGPRFAVPSAPWADRMTVN